MTYEEAQDATVTNTEAAREIRKHGHNPADFFLEYGYKNEYQAADVLAWLLSGGSQAKPTVVPVIPGAGELDDQVRRKLGLKTRSGGRA